MKTSALYFFRSVCALVLMPVVFLVIYPLAYMFLPETTARLADLPRDWTLFLLIEAVLVPVVSMGLYFRTRHGASKKLIREAEDTRDVL